MPELRAKGPSRKRDTLHGNEMPSMRDPDDSRVICDFRDFEQEESELMSELEHDPNENSQKESEEKSDFASSEMAVYKWLHSLQWKGLGEPDGHACLTGRCGETIEIFLNFNGERVKEAAYLTNGCISSRVCAALIAQMAHGKTPDELLDITAQSILSLLGDFPESEEHCAFLAAETLQEALHSYMLKQSESHSGSDREP